MDRLYSLGGERSGRPEEEKKREGSQGGKRRERRTRARRGEESGRGQNEEGSIAALWLRVELVLSRRWGKPDGSGLYRQETGVKAQSNQQRSVEHFELNNKVIPSLRCLRPSNAPVTIVEHFRFTQNTHPQGFTPFRPSSGLFHVL
jgi:hypothetical protein